MNTNQNSIYTPKFTLGPWESVGCAIVSDGRDIARVYQYKGVSEETHAANCRLIAKAPEMYELIQEFFAVMKLEGLGSDYLCPKAQALLNYINIEKEEL
jgi:hypothetical protein